MKKLLAILLALLCMSVCAFAEEVDDALLTGIYMTSLTDAEGTALYDVYMEELPDEAELSFLDDLAEDGVWQVHMNDLADVYVFIAMCDLEDVMGASMADIQGENLEALKAYATVDYSDPVVEMLTTPSGNDYMHIYESDEELRSVCTIFTLYKGAIVELVQYRDDFAPLTEEDHELMNEVLYAIEFHEAQ